MKELEADILIIGAGLTGLTLAYLLKDSNFNIKILEARDRIGGRILTTANEGCAPIEMGATWIGKKHQNINRLLQDLDIDIFEQAMGDHAIYEPLSTSPPQLVQLPHNPEPSYRIKGSSSALIETLYHQIGKEQVYLGHVVKSISMKDEIAYVGTQDSIFKSKFIVSTLPPNLLASSVTIEPSLPNELNSIMNQTHTWMGEAMIDSIKK
ncbi:MAG: FAD-dependent oxidoreductase, partial [Bacteroidota bacterium]